MVGSLDNDDAVSQMRAISAALAHYGWTPKRTVCGCPRCTEEAANAVPPSVHTRDADEAPRDDDEDEDI